MMLRFFALLGAGVAAMSVTAHAQDYPETNIRFAHTLPATGTSAVGDAWVAQEVEKRSGGKVKFQMFWAGAAAAPPEMFDLVSTGGIDAAAITPSWFAANLPFFAPLSSVPFSYPNAASAQKVANALYADVPALKAEADANKLHVMRFPVLNSYHALCTSPVKTIEDFKGKKVRSQGDYMPIVLGTVGATPVTVLPGEFYESLQRGTIDCIVLPWDLIAANRLYEVAKFASNVDFGPIVAHLSLMNLDKWNSLDPSVQKLITEVQADAQAKDMEAVENASEIAIAKMKDNGVEFADFADQEKLQGMIPDLLDNWQKRMADKGAGDVAASMVTEWKKLR